MVVELRTEVKYYSQPKLKAKFLHIFQCKLSKTFIIYLSLRAGSQDILPGQHTSTPEQVATRNFANPAALEAIPPNTN